MGISKGKAMLRSLLISYIFTGVLLVVLAFLLYRFRLGEKQVAMAVNAIYLLTCLIGGLVAGKAVGQRRFFWGLAAGVLYFLILLGVSFAMQKGLNSEIPELMRVLALCAAGGTLGGMIS